MSERAAYSRVYWTLVDDPKFATIYDNDHHLAAWLRLLLIADQAHPASANIPAGTPRQSIKALTDCGLIDLGSGSRYRIHGLDAERSRRRDAATRLRTGQDPDGHQTGPNGDPAGIQTPGRSRGLDEDETRRGQGPAPKRAPDRTVKDPLREAQRAAYIELYGNGSDAPIVLTPSRVMTPAEQEREALRLEALALHERYLAGELEPAEYERLLADLGKQPDDLTRAGT